MSCSIEVTAHFSKEAKRLAKKFPSLRQELALFFDEVAANPTLGTALGMDVFKVRLRISSKGKGKRGGARIITYFKRQAEVVVLLTIYNKGEQSSITMAEIQKILLKSVNPDL